MSSQNITSLRGVGTDYIRHLNLKATLDILKREGPMSRSQLARQLTLSVPTVSSLIDQLGTMGLIQSNCMDTARRGRPANLVQFNEQAGVVVGLELTTNTIRAAISNLSGKILNVLEKPQSRYSRMTESLEQLTSLVNQLLDQNNISWSKILSLCVAIPGIVNSSTGTVVISKHLIGWNQVPLGKLLTDTFHIPVIVENDSRCAALGEQAYGLAKGNNSFVYIRLCEGVGAALIIDGQLLKGEHFMAGEIAYLGTTIEGISKTSLERQYLESKIGIGVIREKTTEAIRRGRRSSLEQLSLSGGNAFTLNDVFDHARENDALAREMLDVVAKGLAYAICNLVAVCDPSLIVLGAVSGVGGELLLSEIRQMVAEQLPYQPKIVLSSLGAEAALTGALRLASNIAQEKLMEK